jgi:hypothetical protein
MKTSGACVICGAKPTVRSHLFPRSLIRRMWGTDKHAIEGELNRPGVKLTQGGSWDDELLCCAHEGALAAADDYAVRFCRRFEKAAILSASGKSYSAPNPRPDLLLRLACSVIWRHVASKHGMTHGLDLGPYRRRFENYLFAGASPPVEALVGRSNLIDPSGRRIEVGIAPYKNRLKEWTIWTFTVGGFDFYVKTDQRSFPIAWKSFLLNDNDPVTVSLIKPLPFHQIPKFQPILAQMREAG